MTITRPKNYTGREGERLARDLGHQHNHRIVALHEYFAGKYETPTASDLRQIEMLMALTIRHSQDVIEKIYACREKHVAGVTP